jgi:hypothetical protein
VYYTFQIQSNPRINEFRPNGETNTETTRLSTAANPGQQSLWTIGESRGESRGECQGLVNIGKWRTVEAKKMMKMQEL